MNTEAQESDQSAVIVAAIEQLTSTLPRALSEKSAAEYIAMSQSYLAKSRMDGVRESRTNAPNFIKVGRAVRYLREDLDNWLDEQQKLEHIGQAEKDK